MARRKIPQDALFFYVGLGPEGSYEQVAKRYGVTKRAVARHAVKERWQERARELEREAQGRAREKALETLEEMNSRHLKLLRVVQGKALEALKAMPLETAIAAVRALGLAIEKEREIRGRPSADQASVESLIRREYETWLVKGEGPEEPPAGKERESGEAV